jgi:hypothetical protein
MRISRVYIHLGTLAARIKPDEYLWIYAKSFKLLRFRIPKAVSEDSVL